MERGLDAEGRGLELDGRSIADALLSDTPIPEREALTVSSHNTYEPDTYPDEGKRMWRTLGLRTADRWWIWDGVEGTRTSRPASYGQDELQERAVREEAKAFQRLEAEWERGVGPGPLIPREYFPTTHWECASLDETSDSQNGPRAPSARYGRQDASSRTSSEDSSNGDNIDVSPSEPDSEEELIRNKLKLLGYIG